MQSSCSENPKSDEAIPKLHRDCFVGAHVVRYQPIFLARLLAMTWGAERLHLC